MPSTLISTHRTQRDLIEWKVEKQETIISYRQTPCAATVRTRVSGSKSRDFSSANCLVSVCSHSCLDASGFCNGNASKNSVAAFSLTVMCPRTHNTSEQDHAGGRRDDVPTGLAAFSALQIKGSYSLSSISSTWRFDDREIFRVLRFHRRQMQAQNRTTKRQEAYSSLSLVGVKNMQHAEARSSRRHHRGVQSAVHQILNTRALCTRKIWY